MSESTIENVAFKSFEEWYDYDDANELVDDLLEMFYEDKEKINKKIDHTLEKERKFRRRLCTSSVKTEIRHFHVVDALNLLYGLDECVGRLQLRRSRTVTAKKCTKQKKCDARAKLLFWLLNLLLF